MTRWITKTLAALICCAVCAAACGDDWPQWLGPQRDSVWRETGIIQSFAQQKPAVKWRVAVSGGYTGPAVAGGRVFVADFQHGPGDASNNPSRRAELQGRERLLCFEADDGKLLWKHEYPCTYRLSYPAGPRTTPTVADGRVYFLGAMGDLCCLDATSGTPIWSKDLKKVCAVEAPLWGFASHPLVDDNRVICLVGGQGCAAVALDKNTGEELWRSMSASEPGYSAPILFGAGPTRQLIIWHADAINGLNPTSGGVHWSVPLKPSYGMSIATPRISGNYLFASGIGNEGVLIQLSLRQPTAEVVWRGDSRNAVYCATQHALH